MRREEPMSPMHAAPKHEATDVSGIRLVRIGARSFLRLVRATSDFLRGFVGVAGAGVPADATTHPAVCAGASHDAHGVHRNPTLPLTAAQARAFFETRAGHRRSCC